MAAGDSLSSWTDGEAKRAILQFVAEVTHKGEHFVPVEDRVAVFDNDGTLWCEKPLPVQADFLLLRLAELAKKDPPLRREQPWRAALDRDYGWFSDVITKHYEGDERELRAMARALLSAYEGVNIEEYQAAAMHFLVTAQHPTLGRKYVECAYQPMNELLLLLEQNGFSNYVVTGGGRDFIRPVSTRLYGIAPQRVIGSSVGLRFEDQGERSGIVHEATLDIFDDGQEKPVQIWNRIGKRPLFAAGNSNGDVAMLRFTKRAGGGPSFGLVVRHDDAGREFAYEAGADALLRRARSEGWTVASIERDWVNVFCEGDRTLSCDS